MAQSQTTKLRTDEPARQNPLRLWPGVVAVLLQLTTLLVPALMPGPTAELLWVAGAFGGALAIAVWWMLFSRAPRFERWGAVGLMLVALVATPLINHRSMGLLSLWLAAYAPFRS